VVSFIAEEFTKDPDTTAQCMIKSMRNKKYRTRLFQVLFNNKKIKEQFGIMDDHIKSEINRILYLFLERIGQLSLFSVDSNPFRTNMTQFHDIITDLDQYVGTLEQHVPQQSGYIAQAAADPAQRTRVYQDSIASGQPLEIGYTEDRKEDLVVPSYVPAVLTAKDELEIYEILRTVVPLPSMDEVVQEPLPEQPSIWNWVVRGADTVADITGFTSYQESVCDRFIEGIDFKMRANFFDASRIIIGNYERLKQIVSSFGKNVQDKSQLVQDTNTAIISVFLFLYAVSIIAPIIYRIGRNRIEEMDSTYRPPIRRQNVSRPPEEYEPEWHGKKSVRTRTKCTSKKTPGKRLRKQRVRKNKSTKVKKDGSMNERNSLRR